MTQLCEQMIRTMELKNLFTNTQHAQPFCLQGLSRLCQTKTIVKGKESLPGGDRNTQGFVFEECCNGIIFPAFIDTKSTICSDRDIFQNIT